MHYQRSIVTGRRTSPNSIYKSIGYAVKVHIILILSIFTTTCFSQDNKIESKIDPAFQLLINANPEVKALPKKKCFLKRKSKSKSSVSSAYNEIKYDCIIYTTNAQALRVKGITINSVLPQFVTAKASLLQIQQMALMNDVTYIASPGMDSVPAKN